MSLYPRVTPRQSTRLRDIDYSQAGADFNTIVAYQRRCSFGEISDCKIILSRYGGTALYEWFMSSDIRHEIELHEDEFVIMPNHIHGIVWIIHKDKTPNKSTSSKTLLVHPSECVTIMTGLSEMIKSHKLYESISAIIPRGGI